MRVSTVSAETEVAAWADPETSLAFARLTARASVASEVEPEVEPEGRTVELVPASTIRMAETRWAWAGRVPLGGVTLLVGTEGAGKTTIAADVCARATRGALDGDLDGQPVSVVYASAEDSWARTLAPRFSAAGADMDRVFFVQVDGLAGGLSVPGDLDMLKARMRDADARILVLDPLGAHLHDSLDTHRDAAVRRALAPLADSMDRIGAAAIGVMHWSKAPTTIALDRVNGSRAFTAAARSMLAVAPDPEDEGAHVVVVAKSNLGRLDIPALRYMTEGREVVSDTGAVIGTSGVRWLGEAAGVTVHDVFAVADDPEERSDRDAVAEIVQEVLAGGPQQRDVVVKAIRAAGLDVSAKTIQRACRGLGVERKRIGFGDTFVLALPDATIVDRPPLATIVDRPRVHNGHTASEQGSYPSESGSGDHCGHENGVLVHVSTMAPERPRSRQIETFDDGTPVPDASLFADDDDEEF